ncbi:MAG: phage terminase small subunit [Denitratisoma sp.]|nr:phage terminase small subunit [Denitratisoma sp.]
MDSPARRHFQRVSAANRQAAETPATRSDATAYELMLLKLAEDKRRLSDIQSLERRAEIKRELLPEYAPWVQGALEGGHGVQDDVLMTVMVWSIDTGDLEQALRIGAYALAHQLAMPDQYKRGTACLIAEELADHALRLKDGIDEATTASLIAADGITAGQDMPDEVRAKLLKAIGLGLDLRGDKPAALDHLKRALALHDKVGVKKDIERLEREIKNLAGSPTGNG